MKKFIVALTVLFTSFANAASMFDGMSKEELAGYEILVVKKDSGKVVGKMSRATHKVVSLESSEAAAEVTIAKEKAAEETIAKLTETQQKRYSVIATAGVGNDGLVNKYNAGTYEISERRALVGQVTGCVNGSHNLGYCATASTNEFYGLGLKYDFGK